jgi:hypothetical protein
VQRRETRRTRVGLDQRSLEHNHTRSLQCFSRSLQYVQFIALDVQLQRDGSDRILLPGE